MSETIKSLSKALEVLECLSLFPNGTSLQTISQKSGHNKSSVHRILSTFEEMGYVSQVGMSKDYRLTTKLVQIGYSAMHSDVTGIVKPHLNQLLSNIDETVNFLSFDADHIIFKDKLEPANATFRTRTYIGLSSPMYCSAAGKCYLAFSSDEVRQAYWQRNSSTMKPLTNNTILEKDAFFAHLDEIKQRGYAIDDEENEIGISCVAVPILDRQHNPVYAISISSLTPRIRNYGFEHLANLIQQTTKQIEESING
ncbi:MULTISPECIES: IclR family transcriptional regulator [unclassified Vibrio]|uniref:IclR family transcriptional regulator n=1 Tax=Vibrio sp. HB236076 TaxID=3232307 RepID=A0AB39HA79_9VIBR|nr:IclR family transcriptional regulator [Vibrio sp. HB161653]MDP5255424.1 IclR family transcriptional regulator [Vibrio sp. HB161653]